ncbi:peptidase M76 family-domain-containing protein [Entophlyctis helioformis]|nr:peptidase M76 family-domain-containing protein [Entophlyctis helioformis]
MCATKQTPSWSRLNIHMDEQVLDSLVGPRTSNSNESSNGPASHNATGGSSLRIRRLLQGLADSGCPFQRGHFQLTAECPPGVAGGFDPERGIVLCTGTLVSRAHMEDTIAHELVHAYDQCTTRFDPMNCRHLACTEIRAASLSGDCRLATEWMRGNFGFKGAFEQCVRRRATLAVSMQPHCAANAAQMVDSVYGSCLADTQPFTASDLSDL